MLHERILKLINDHGVNLSEESVLLVFKDGHVSVSLENKKIDMEIELTDKVVVLDESLDNILSEE